MHKIKMVCILAIALLLVPTISFDMIPTASAGAQKRIVLPFHTSWENDPSEAVGRTNAVDWKTSDFYGYYGPNNNLQPECGLRNNEVAPPNVYGFNFGSRQLLAAGYFGSSYSYCYFDLFDQTGDSDYGPPIQLQEHTFINIWYYHSQLTCCMIDGELYNPHENRWSTLRDFTYNSQYVQDQNHVRIHPAARRADPTGSWQFATFDLSIVYQEDPGNWYITKIWIGFDNDPSYGSPQTGQARTYFDMLFISYGVNSVFTKYVDSGWFYGCGATHAQIRGSVIAWDKHLNTDGSYSLWLKIMAMGSTLDNYLFCPIAMYTDVSSNYTVQALDSPKPTGINISTPDPTATKVAEFLLDCAETAISAAAGPFGIAIDAAWLAAHAVGIFFSKPTYDTYVWWANYDWYGNHVQSAIGEVYVLVTIPPGTRATIPIEIGTDVYAFSAPTGGIPAWYYMDTVSTNMTMRWTTPDIDTNPLRGPPSVTLTRPFFQDQTLKHFGNPNGNDCNMQIGPASTGAWMNPGQTCTVEYWGNIWARPGSPGNIMVAVLGMDDTPLDTTGTMGPGAYPGQSYDRTFSFTVPNSPGNHIMYGMAAAVISTDQAKQQYISYPSMRFQVGTITIGNWVNPTIYVHSATFTATADIAPPQCYLLNPQVIGGQTYYAYTWLTDSAGNQIGTTQGMICSQPATQGRGTGGTFTCPYDLSTLSRNAYYYVYVHADGTNGKGYTAGRRIYYYNNAPYAPPAPSGATSGYTSTSYTYSSSTADPDGDSISYQFDWGDGSSTTTGFYTTGTTATASHTWSSSGTYNVTVRAKDSYGPWSSWSPILTVTMRTGGGGGGCPTLFSWNGKDFAEEALLDIHNDQDVTVDYALKHLKPTGSTCMLQLRELDNFTSDIDYARLYAVDENGNWHECNLILARHSNLGPVTTELLFDDDTRVNLAPSQTIQLFFSLSRDIRNIQCFIFELDGYNSKTPLLV